MTPEFLNEISWYITSVTFALGTFVIGFAFGYWAKKQEY